MECPQCLVCLEADLKDRVLAGNAGGITMGNNVFITRWMEQFQDAGYFFETVLWMHIPA